MGPCTMEDESFHGKLVYRAHCFEDEGCHQYYVLLLQHHRNVLALHLL